MRMPHDFHQEGREVETAEGNLSAHQEEVERFRQRQQRPSRHRRQHAGLWVIGLLLLIAGAYAVCAREQPAGPRKVDQPEAR